MRSAIQFATAPSSDTPGTTIFLNYDDKRYLFGNLAEGTQRASIENGVRLAKLSQIFLTGKTSWSTIGGLLGMLLTLSDTMASASNAALETETQKIKNIEKRLKTAVKQIEIDELTERLARRKDELANSPEFQGQCPISLYGGPNLVHTLATGRTFICRTSVPIEIREFGSIDSEEVNTNKDLSTPDWSDENIKVWALPVFPSISRGQTRKRSLDEFKETDVAVPFRTTQKEDMTIRQKVVLDMFNSQWRLDTLEETPLAEVSLPATLFIRDSETDKVKPYEGPKPGDGQPLPDINVLVRKPWPGAMVDSIPATAPSDCALSYIICGHDLRGKFDRSRADALKITDKSLYKKLASGESVISADGRTITPDMVLGESRPGKGFAVIEVPSVDYIESIVGRKEWQTPDIMKGMEIFIWILGPGVGGHPLLREFVGKMGQYEHIVSSSDYCPDRYGFPNSASAAIDFSAIDGARYQTPYCNNDNEKELTHFAPTNSKKSISIAEPGLVIDFEPKVKVNKKGIPRPVSLTQPNGRVPKRNSHANIVGESFDLPGAIDSAEALKNKIPNADAEVISLGTGSSCPSKYRNVSGTLLRVPGIGNYLLDCGEGSLGQLKRIFGPEELKEVFRDLKAIWISHLHADHHLGTTSIVKAWYECVFGAPPTKPAALDITEADVPKILSEKRLFVISAPHMLQWMAEYSNVENYGFDKVVPLSASSYESPDGEKEFSYTIYRREKNGRVMTDAEGNQLGTRLQFENTESPLTELLKKGTGLKSLLTTPVPHCQGAKGVAFVFPTGFKVSYSGDCRPCTRFIEIGKGSTLLIHEATFDDNMLSDAVAKRHSTISEAMTVGLHMEAKVIVLTHFSQRYRKMPDIENAREVHIRPARPWSSKTGSSDKIPRQAPSVVRDIPTSVDTDEDYTLSNQGDQIEQDHGKIDTLSTASPTPKQSSASAQSQFGRPPIILAFDNMRLRVGDAIYAESYQPQLKDYLEKTPTETH